MDFASKRITAGGGPGAKEYTTSLLQNPEKLGFLRQRTTQRKPRREPLTKERLLQVEQQGNEQKPLRPNHSDNYQVNIVECQEQWEAYAADTGRGCWRELVKSISWETKGLLHGFLTWTLEREKSRVGTFSSLQRYVLKTWTVYKKYTTKTIDKCVKEHGMQLARELAVFHGLRFEPKHKDSLGPGMFLYLAYVRVVRDRTTFNIGLDRLDDMTIRLFFMYAAVRTHEVVYAPRQANEKKKAKYHDKDDAFADLEKPPNCIRRAPCWVCGEEDERTEASRKVLCWEDIVLWILRDPAGKSRDCFAMQVLFRFHKGHNKEIRPTFYLFVEEDLPIICPITHILAKVRAEDVIDREALGDAGNLLDSAEALFNTKIDIPAVWIPWKREFWHVPVFRRSEKCLEGYTKSMKPMTRSQLDSRSDTFGRVAGLPGKLHASAYRRGNLEATDTHYRQSVRNQAARHKPNSTVYETYYHNMNMNAVFQDAYLGRGTASPWLTVLNHMGVICDEEAPTEVSDEMMQAIGPDDATSYLEEQMAPLRERLEREYGRASSAIGPDKAAYDRLLNQLRAARQNHRRKILEEMRKEYFKFRNVQELKKQLQGIRKPERPPPEPIFFSLPERRRLVRILGDLNEELSEDAIVRRKIDAINAWVAYAWKVEPMEQKPKQGMRTPSDHVVPIEDAAIKDAPMDSPVEDDPIKDIPMKDSPIDDPIEDAPMKDSPIDDPTKDASVKDSLIEDVPAKDSTFKNPQVHWALQPPPPIAPPPPYTEVMANSNHLAASTSEATIARRRTPRKLPHSCIFCGKSFTRNTTMWGHVENHLQLESGSHIPCPFLECKAKGLRFGRGVPFKAHVFDEHKVELRQEKGQNPWVPKEVPTLIRIAVSPRDSRGAQMPTKVVSTNRGQEPRAIPTAVLANHREEASQDASSKMWPPRKRAREKASKDASSGALPPRKRVKASKDTNVAASAPRPKIILRITRG